MFYPRVPLKKMDPAMLVFELNRETARLMPDHSELITSAATVASHLHRNQTRMVRGDLPKVPYIEHPLRVALRLIRWGITDAHIIAAALLHDTLEDCAQELVSTFGEPWMIDYPPAVLSTLYDVDPPVDSDSQIDRLVQAVTNPEPGTTSYQDHLANLASEGSTGALLIKASDLKDNAGSIKHQLGHGKDARLFRLAAKYYQPVKMISAELAVRNELAAHTDLEKVHQDLVELAIDNNLDLG